MPWLSKGHECSLPVMWPWRQLGAVWQCPKCRKRYTVVRNRYTGYRYYKRQDQREPGESFCRTCPDHEACMQGAPCPLVKRVNAPKDKLRRSGAGF